MKKQLLIPGIFFLLFFSDLLAQQSYEYPYYFSKNTESRDKTTFDYKKILSAQKFVNKCLNVLGKEDYYIPVFHTSEETCYSTPYNGSITLNVNWLNKFRNKDDWFHLYVIGHEIGHLLLNHEGGYSDNKVENHKKELDCDMIGAKLIYEFGFPFKNIESIWPKDFNFNTSLTHPPTSNRIKLINSVLGFLRENDKQVNPRTFFDFYNFSIVNESKEINQLYKENELLINKFWNFPNRSNYENLFDNCMSLYSYDKRSYSIRVIASATGYFSKLNSNFEDIKILQQLIDSYNNPELILLKLYFLEFDLIELNKNDYDVFRKIDINKLPSELILNYCSFGQRLLNDGLVSNSFSSFLNEYHNNHVKNKHDNFDIIEHNFIHKHNDWIYNGNRKKLNDAISTARLGYSLNLKSTQTDFDLSVIIMGLEKDDLNYNEETGPIKKINESISVFEISRLYNSLYNYLLVLYRNNEYKEVENYGISAINSYNQLVNKVPLHKQFSNSNLSPITYLVIRAINDNPLLDRYKKNSRINKLTRFLDTQTKLNNNEMKFIFSLLDYNYDPENPKYRSSNSNKYLKDISKNNYLAGNAKAILKYPREKTWPMNNDFIDIDNIFSYYLPIEVMRMIYSTDHIQHLISDLFESSKISIRNINSSSNNLTLEDNFEISFSNSVGDYWIRSTCNQITRIKIKFKSDFDKSSFYDLYNNYFKNFLENDPLFTIKIENDIVDLWPAGINIRRLGYDCE